jgi:hypothetical protein
MSLLGLAKLTGADIPTPEEQKDIKKEESGTQY